MSKLGEENKISAMESLDDINLDEVLSMSKGSQLKGIWKRFCKNKLAVLGLIIFMIVLLTALFEPYSSVKRSLTAH